VQADQNRLFLFRLSFPESFVLTTYQLTTYKCVHCQFNGKRLPPICNMIANHLGPAPCILLFPRRHKHPRSFTASDVFISPRSATADPETCRIFNSILLDPSSPRRGTVAYTHTYQAFSTSTTLGSTFRSSQTRLGCGCLHANLVQITRISLPCFSVIRLPRLTGFARIPKYESVDVASKIRAKQEPGVSVDPPTLDGSVSIPSNASWEPLRFRISSTIIQRTGSKGVVM
jgi:hypothetical protein